MCLIKDCWDMQWNISFKNSINFQNVEYSFPLIDFLSKDLIQSAYYLHFMSKIVFVIEIACFQLSEKIWWWVLYKWLTYWPNLRDCRKSPKRTILSILHITKSTSYERQKLKFRVFLQSMHWSKKSKSVKAEKSRANWKTGNG